MAKTILPTNTGPLEPTVAPFHARTAIGQGLMMGGGDELEAWVRSKLSGRPYEEIRQEIMKDVRSFSEQFPASAATQEFAGAALPFAASAFFPPLEPLTGTRAMGALAKAGKYLAYNPQRPILSGAKVGIGAGAVGGGLSAEPDSRLTGAVVGGATGGTFGTLFPMLSKATGNIGGFVLRQFTGEGEGAAEREAARKMGEEFRAQGVDFPTVMSGARQDERLGVPSSLAHYLPSTAEAVIAKSGTPEAVALAKSMQEKQRGATGRIQDKFRDKLKPKNYFAEEEALTKELRTNANTLYENAYAFGQVDDPRIMEALNNPTFKKAYEEARNIAETEATAAKLSGGDPSQFALKEVYYPKEIKPGIFELELRELPDVRTLDYIKRGLDGIIERGYKGEGMSTAQANALKDLRNQFVKALDENVPEYAAARAKYAGDLEVRDALRMGMKDFNRLKEEEITKFMSTASGAEKEAFRTGAMRYLQDTIFDKPNAAGKILSSNKFNSKLQALFDSPEEYALIKAAMEKEALFYSKASDALSGSRTTPKAEAIERVTNAQPQEGAGNLIGSITRFLLHGEDKFSPQVLGKMADMLNTGGPDEVAAVVRAIEKREKQANVGRVAGEAVVKGTIGGTAGGTTTPEITSESSAGDIMLNELIDYYNSRNTQTGGDKVLE